MSEDFLTVLGQAENTIVIERSKFICYLKGIQDENEAKEFIAKIKKQHSLATHNCYAYIADEKGLCAKFSDDGEPQGTAGLPMLEVLKNRKIYKTVAVITRYFGGIKLGTGGLTRAYAGAVIECLGVATLKKMQISDFYEINLDYEKYSVLLKIFDENCKVIASDFSERIYLKIAVKKEESQKLCDKLNDAFCGSLDFKKIDSGYFGF